VIPERLLDGNNNVVCIRSYLAFLFSNVLFVNISLLARVSYNCSLLKASAVWRMKVKNGCLISD
jgi:hypothetical protein